MTRFQPPTARALLGGVLAVTLLLAGCGGSNDTDQGAGPTAGASSTTGPASPSPSGMPADGPHNIGDVTFATGMLPHHAQAVEMSDLIIAKDDIDPTVRQLAEQIKAAQAPEIEQMHSWLVGWGEPVPTADAMGGMDHSQHGGSMSGIMSEAEMSALADATGAAVADLFLEQMIKHHLGAIPMAKTELREGENPDAKELAQRIITTQESEIITMTELLGS